MRTRKYLYRGVLLVLLVGLLGALARPTQAATPSSGTLTAPADSGTVSVEWSGGPYTAATPDPNLCANSTVNCDYFTVTINAPANYWDSHEGSVTFRMDWTNSANDFDMYIYDSDGHEVDYSAAGGTNYEEVRLEKLAPGTYTVEVVAWLTTNASYTGSVTLEATKLPPGMTFNEDKNTILDLLEVEYPLNIIFVGYHPTPAEIADMKGYIPEQYQPTIASKSPAGDEVQNEGAGLLNWNRNHLTNSDPYFLGIRYKYNVRFIQASDDYAKALYQVAEDHTAQNYSYKASSDRDDLVRYNSAYGHYRVAAKGDPSYAVTDATTIDLIDAFAVEDWIFDSRHDAQWDCAFTDLESGACLDPSIIQPQDDAYYDPYYDKNGLNLDHMPQGVNQGTSYFFFDTFSPDYAADYFRPNAYHNWGTDKVINGQIIDAPIEDGGSWRITDPDTGDWDGVDYGRTWGGRYRFHWVDLGAAPNNFESASWLRAERTLSSDYPHGDPPIWQYLADPNWQQSADDCAADPSVTNYTGGTPCRMMPRLARDVAYGLFFRSTPGYLYRPIPRGDVYWLAVSNWTDFYSRPQWVNGQLTSAPWYGIWWTDMSKLYKINEVGNNDDDVLRWLSSALPYARWVGREGEVIELYDPTNNQPTGEFLDTSPKYEDLPAPQYHVHSSAIGQSIAPEPLYPPSGQHVTVQYGSKTVDLTEVSNAIEKAKARGFVGLSYDGSVSHTYVRDYIDANPDGIADQVPGVNTIPSINLVFEKAYTWALPAIVGGIAVQTNDGEAWGVMNNVNDRFKWSESHYPPVQQTDPTGSKRSMPIPALPTQESGTGFSYTIEHEAAHNLGLSHPHDGSYGVSECPAGDPDEGEWKCYWEGLGWMFDISAAPTTYAMAYRPYEVEDQDNLQRGHVAEYLVAAQNALRDRLVAEAAAGATTPSSGYTADFARMADWRLLASELFQCGDYLHAEYAARNASLAARGIPQTEANTVDPRLVEAGQVFYFNVHPQGLCSHIGNTAPVAVDDVATATSGLAVDINVLANDSDPDGDALTVIGVDTPANGTAQVVGNQVRYTSNAGYTGADSVTYTISDGRTGEDTATVSITVIDDNDPPVADDDSATTLKNTGVNINVLTNDSDPNNDPLTITAVTDPANGSATTDGSTIDYTPDAGFVGTDTFAYTISDGRGGSDHATVTVTVNDDGSGGGDTGHKVTGGGYLYTVGGERINFGFNAKEQTNGLQGHLNLNDRDAGVKIKLTTLTALGDASGACGTMEGAVNAVEFRGDGTINGAAASFRVCAEDNGEGNGAAPDRLVVECTSGCSYSTADRASDDAIDGGNIQLHHVGSASVAPATTQATSGKAGTASPAQQGAQPTVLILDPVLLTEGIAGRIQPLTVVAYDNTGDAMADATVTLSFTGADGSQGTLSGLTNASGVAIFSVTLLPTEVDYVATSGSLSSNYVEVSGLLQ